MKTFNFTQAAALAIFVATIAVTPCPAASTSEPQFDGKHYRDRGDVEYLRLLDTARRMFEPDPELQNLAMLYEPKWDGFVEGPTWDAWWIQNSYGTTYSILPLLREPFVTFLQHAQDLWFDQMGDGHRTGATPPFDWVAPDGCLCDAARPGWIVYKQRARLPPCPAFVPMTSSSRTIPPTMTCMRSPRASGATAPGSTAGIGPPARRA